MVLRCVFRGMPGEEMVNAPVHIGRLLKRFANP